MMTLIFLSTVIQLAALNAHALDTCASRHNVFVHFCMHAWKTSFIELEAQLEVYLIQALLYAENGYQKIIGQSIGQFMVTEKITMCNAVSAVLQVLNIFAVNNHSFSDLVFIVECDTVNRHGGKAGALRTCRGCNGRGVKIQLRQIGPGIVQQVQSVCGQCQGQGNTVTKTV